jgi:hypothetical protein
MTESPFRWFPDGLDDDLLGLPDVEVLRALNRPTLVRVPGSGDLAPRAIATLLHGDESTGFEAVMRVLRRQRPYPFDLYVIIGNVRAALAERGFAHRYLDDQEDFNRIWGVDEPTTMLRMAADGIHERLLGAGLESLVDVHNNTGNNPFYALVTRRDPAMLNLATLFTTTLVAWDLHVNTLMESMPVTVAAVAIECGLPGRPESLAFAVDGIRRYLGEPALPTDRVVRDYDLLGDLRRVVVRPEVRFRFADDLSEDVDFAVQKDADVANFVEVTEGHVLGHVHDGAAMPLRATDANGKDITDEHFHIVGDAVVFSQPATPIMMTKTVEAARKDCLFYIASEL